MPIPTPFHPRTSELCSSMLFKEWAGHYAVRSFDTSHEREYYAFRQSAGMIDVTPLFKYEVRGRDAAAFLARVTVRDIRRLPIGRMVYLCWCDDDGKVVDDGTVARLADTHFRVTAAEPSLAWLQQRVHGDVVTVEDSSLQIGALSIQGPSSRAILKDTTDANLDELKFFGITEATLGGAAVHVSRTGYTGDLGFEVWVDREHALTVWDAIMAVGRKHRLEPAGLDAMDVTRVEAGFIMNGVDYDSANHCLLESRKLSPFEIGLGWTVKLDRDPFIGQAALKAERASGSRWARVGLVYDWDEYEALFAEFDLPPQVPSAAWRTPVPIYNGSGQQIGRATSGAWSPLLKANLALALVRPDYAGVGTRVRIEVTAEFERRLVTATVAKTPFFDPDRKRA